MDRDIIAKKLKKLDYLNKDERNEIVDKMLAEWKNTEKEWGDPLSFDGLSKDDYKAKIKALGRCFAFYLTEKVKEKTVSKMYDKLFGKIKASDNPSMIIVAGAIASGKSTVVECVIPKKYEACGIVDKDKIKASNIFRDYIHSTFGDEHGNLIEDFMLSLRDDIGRKAMEDKKSMLLEQSCKTKDFLETCKLAKQKYGFKICAEVVITPIAFTCARNVYRYVKGLSENPKTARYEAYLNIKETYDKAPEVLEELKKNYADEMTVYTSDILIVETKDKPMAKVFNDVVNGPVSDISFEIAEKICDYINFHIALIQNNPDVLYSLSVTKQKLKELKENPEMIVPAQPQNWQPRKVRNMLNKLNAPLGLCYSERLKQNMAKK
ncbi:MAG: zeta toxin family protein [Oscillospiraceae bacterium]|nr:zeta toxin family protein [Oscillospiraceae bacterium]